MKQFNSTILLNRSLGADYFEMALYWPIQDAPGPGQFLTLRVSDKPFPLLRRPFAVSRYNRNENYVRIIYKRRGAATRELAGKKEGERIDVIGPLGNTFPNPQEGRRALILAGGIGLGPMIYFTRTLIQKGQNPIFVFGCRSADSLPKPKDLGELNACLCTDDGTLGYHGSVIDFAHTLAGCGPFDLFGCGPNEMLKACHRFSDASELHCWVSMEQTMGCAMGACMGCVIRTVKEPGFARVCKDGPIFASGDIKWS